MNAETAKKMAEGLGQLPLVRNCTPVRVVVARGKRTAEFFGVRYEMVHPSDRSNPKALPDRRIDLLGERPKFAKARTREYGELVAKNVYTVAGDDADWFVCCYIDPPIPAEYLAYHPFGPTWCLSRWDHEQIGRIDKHGRSRIRLPITVETL